MHLKILSLFAAILLVAACSSTPEESIEGSATGTQAEDQSANTTITRDSAADALDGRIQDDTLTNVGDRIFFDLDRSDLSPEAQDTLRELADWLTERPGVGIALEGHADERGTREYNLALGARRASAARDFLMALGVDGRRLTTVSYGKERPAVSGSSEVSWAQNRRSVFVVK